MPMEIDSLTTCSKSKSPLLSLLITRILTFVAEEGVPYQRTIFRAENPNTCFGRRIFFSVRESKIEGKKIFWQIRIPLLSKFFPWINMKSLPLLRKTLRKLPEIAPQIYECITQESGVDFEVYEAVVSNFRCHLSRLGEEFSL